MLLMPPCAISAIAALHTASVARYVTARMLLRRHYAAGRYFAVDAILLRHYADNIRITLRDTYTLSQHSDNTRHHGLLATHCQSQR